MKSRTYFPKLVNLWGFISYYHLIDLVLSTSDKFFLFQLIGFGDNACVNTSLIKLEINLEYDGEIDIHLNLLFLFHLKYERNNFIIKDGTKPGNDIKIIECDAGQKYIDNKRHEAYEKAKQERNEMINDYNQNYSKLNRNDKCSCGSNKKFKVCCLPKFKEKGIAN